MAPAKQKRKHKGKTIGVDFKKVKHKVGRKLKPAANVTKVEVKSKTIVLPGQSVHQDKDGLALSNRRQTLKELLTQLTHHNDNVRRDAISSIKDLLVHHPKELSLHAVSLVEKLSSRITDSSKNVRQVLLDLLRTTIYAGLPHVLMRPLVPVTMAYIFSAMTNMATDIRMSAYGFLDALIHSYPFFAADYVDEIFRYYVDFLGKLGVAAQSGNHLPKVLDSLIQFLSAVHTRSRSSKIGSMNNSGGNTSFLALHWYKSVKPEVNASLKGEKTFIQLEGTKGKFTFQAADLLIKALLSCWAECSSLVCSGQAPDKESMLCMRKICDALHAILLCIDPNLEWVSFPDHCSNFNNLTSCSSTFDVQRLEVQEWIRNSFIPSIRRNVISCFPIAAPPLNLPRNVEEILLSLNVCLLKVILSSIIAGDMLILEEQEDFMRLLEYFEDAVDGRMFSILGLSLKATDKGFAESHIMTLIAFIPSILHRITRYHRIRLLQAFTKVFKNCKPTSKLTRVCLSCIGEVLQPSYSIRQNTGGVPMLIDMFELQKQWLQSLPKLLWELKHNCPSSSLAILRVLHHLGRSAPYRSPLAEEYNSLQLILIPFFCTISPTRKGEILGPFIKLPNDCQTLAIDLMYYFDELSTPFLKAVIHCLCLDLKISVVVRCLEVLQAAYCRGSVKLSDHLSFVFTLLMQFKESKMGMREGAEDDIDVALQFKNSQILTSVICSCLLQLGDRKSVLHLLKSIICEHLAVDLTRFASYRLISVVSVLSGCGKAVLLPRTLFELLPHFIAKYLITVFMGSRSKNKENNDFLNALILPSIHLLSKSAKMAESVIEKLCQPSDEGLVYGHVSALLEVLGIDHVASRLLVISEETSLLRSLKGRVDHLEEREFTSLLEKISKAAANAYGWNGDRNS